MKTVIYEAFQKQKKKKIIKIWGLLDKKRLPSSRKRSHKKRLLLMELDKKRKERWEKEGILALISPRCYLLKL